MNLYGFVDNDGVNRWDYLGLKRLTKEEGLRVLDGLEKALSDMARKCCKCNYDSGSKMIADKIKEAWRKHWGTGHGWPYDVTPPDGSSKPTRPSGHAVGGHWCFHWAKGFQNYVESIEGRFWSAKLGIAKKRNVDKDGKSNDYMHRRGEMFAFHMWLEIRMCGNESDECTMILDDGFFDGENMFRSKADWLQNFGPDDDWYESPHEGEAEETFEDMNTGDREWRRPITPN